MTRLASQPGIPEPVTDEVTGVLEGEALRAARGKRDTADRLAKLEDKHDALVRDVTETRVIVGEMSGKLEVLPQLVSMVRQQADRAERRQTLQEEDALDARRHSRQRITQAAGWFFGAGGGLVLLLKLLGVL